MFNSGNYSLADVAAATKDADGFGGNGSWWIILLFFFFFVGGFGGGFGGNASLQGALTRADLNQEMGFSDLQNTMRSTRVDLSNDYHDLSTNILQNVCDLNGTINSGFNSVTGGLSNLGYEVQAGMNNINVNNMQNTYALGTQLNGIATQIANSNCGLTNQIDRSFSDTNYNLATQANGLQQSMCNNTRDLIENQNANTRSILEFLTQDKIATLQNENQNLKLAASQAAQNSYLIDALRPSPMPAYVVQNPYCSCGMNI